eukprot:3056280-Rhodomonas_salina.1
MKCTTRGGHGTKVPRFPKHCREAEVQEWVSQNMQVDSSKPAAMLATVVDVPSVCSEQDSATTSPAPSRLQAAGLPA